MATKKTEHVRAVTSFICEVDGVQRIVGSDEVLRRTDPVVKSHPELFEDHQPVEERTEPLVG
jgi:hypothetical protein